MTTDDVLSAINVHAGPSRLPALLMTFFECWYRDGRPGVDWKMVGDYVRKTWPQDFEDICRGFVAEARRKGYLPTLQPGYTTFRWTWTSTATSGNYWSVGP